MTKKNVREMPDLVPLREPRDTRNIIRSTQLESVLLDKLSKVPVIANLYGDSKNSILLEILLEKANEHLIVPEPDPKTGLVDIRNIKEKDA